MFLRENLYFSIYRAKDCFDIFLESIPFLWSHNFISIYYCDCKVIFPAALAYSIESAQKDLITY